MFFFFFYYFWNWLCVLTYGVFLICFISHSLFLLGVRFVFICLLYYLCCCNVKYYERWHLLWWYRYFSYSYLFIFQFNPLEFNTIDWSRYVYNLVWRVVRGKCEHLLASMIGMFTSGGGINNVIIIFLYAFIGGVGGASYFDMMRGSYTNTWLSRNLLMLWNI